MSNSKILSTLQHRSGLLVPAERSQQNFRTSIHLSRPEDNLKLFIFGLTSYIVTLISWIAYPLIRVNFGERNFSMIYGLLVLAGMKYMQVSSVLIGLYGIALVCHFIWNYTRRRNFGDPEWHSKSFGISIAYLFVHFVAKLRGIDLTNSEIVNEKNFNLFVDPIVYILICIPLVGISLFQIHSMFIIWAGAFAVFWREMINASLMRDKVLQQRDSKIESEILSDIDKSDIGKLNNNHKGFHSYGHILSANSTDMNPNEVIDFDDNDNGEMDDQFEQLRKGQNT